MNEIFKINVASYYISKNIYQQNVTPKRKTNRYINFKKQNHRFGRFCFFFIYATFSEIYIDINPKSDCNIIRFRIKEKKQ